MSVFSWLFLGLLAYASLRLVVFVVAAHTYARLRLRPHRFDIADGAALPVPVQRLFERGARELEAHGFAPDCVLSAGPSLPGDSESTPHALLRRADGSSWALLAPSAAPVPGAPLDLVLVSYFADGTSLVTVSGAKLDALADLPGKRLLDTLRADWTDQVRDHLAALARSGAQGLSLDRAELLEHANRDLAASLAVLEPAPDAEHELRLPMRRALWLALRAMLEIGAYNKLQDQRLARPTWLPEAPEAQRWAEARALGLLQHIRALPPRRELLWAGFVTTAAAFAASMALYASFAFILQLTLVLLVHELGHWLAMQLTGYRKPSIVFVPFFGAATVGEKPDATLWQELLVLLAGPLPGVLAGAALLASGVPLSAPLRELAQLALLLNAGNLLPLWPLDGGRIVHRLVLRDRPGFEAAMCVGSALVFGALAWDKGEPLLALLSAALLLSAHGSFCIARLTQRARALAPRTQAELRAAALSATAELKETFPQRAAVALRMIERLGAPPSSTGQRAAAGAGYLALLALAIMATRLTGSVPVRPTLARAQAEDTTQQRD